MLVGGIPASLQAYYCSSIREKCPANYLPISMKDIYSKLSNPNTFFGYMEMFKPDIANAMRGYRYSHEIGPLKRLLGTNGWERFNLEFACAEIILRIANAGEKIPIILDEEFGSKKIMAIRKELSEKSRSMVEELPQNFYFDFDSAQKTLVSLAPENAKIRNIPEPNEFKNLESVILNTEKELIQFLRNPSKEHAPALELAYAS